MLCHLASLSPPALQVPELEMFKVTSILNGKEVSTSKAFFIAEEKALNERNIVDQ